jgi:hypothetical protein
VASYVIDNDVNIYVYICMYVYVYVYIHICMYVYILHINMCVYTSRLSFFRRFSLAISFIEFIMG